MSRKRTNPQTDRSEMMPPRLEGLIKRDLEATPRALTLIVSTLPVDEARRRRAGLSPTAADIEAVRRGDRGSALEHLADRLSRGWIEAPWGGDPATATPCEVISPSPWQL